ncbi:MAG: undecaprenyl-phosphate glucose phosphotransferase [Ignavibacteriaceae bacterium]|nr:undecaprenyl-phosphate glucose phosphotransferase [Ignavibacteriaceae bacterium]
MFANKKSYYYLRLFCDLILLNISFTAAAILAQSFHILLSRNHMFILLAGLNFVWLFFSNVIGFYEDTDTRYFAYQFVNILKNVIAQGFTAIVFIFLIKEDLFTRNFIIYYSVFLILGIGLRIIVFKFIIISLRKSGKGIRNLLIIGVGDVALNFHDILRKNPDLGYDFIGYLDDKNSPSDGEKILGGINDLEKVIIEKKIEEVVIAIPDSAAQLLDGIIRVCNKNAVRAHIIPDYFRFLSRKFKISMIGNFPVISVRNEPLEEIHWKILKRTFDIVFSFTFLVLIYSWLFPVIAFFLKKDSKGPAIFKQDRIGVRNIKFICYKFRTLYSEEKESGKFVPVTNNDPRITGFGRFLRKSNLDEIPQFINVLKGEMSVVGPRPHAIPYDDKYTTIVEDIRLRHNVKPGITGWAQVHGLRGDTFSEEENTRRTIKRIEHDIWYIENWTFLLDIQIIILTIWQMIKRDTKGI